MTRDDVLRYLPAVYAGAVRGGGPLDALVEIMAALLAPLSDRLDDLDGRFDPRRADSGFTALLAVWSGLEGWLEPDRRSGSGRFAPGEAQLRETMAVAARLGRIRGTREAILGFLAAATGDAGFELGEDRDAGGAARAFHVHVVAPARCAPFADLIWRIVTDEKPAYCTASLAFAAEKEPPS